MTTGATGTAGAWPAAIVAVCLLVAFTLAGCGENDTGGTAAGTTTDSLQPASTDEPEPSSSSPSTELEDATSATASPTTTSRPPHP